jgi:putative nucleotidyltransferase with HDIG domain
MGELVGVGRSSTLDRPRPQRLQVRGFGADIFTGPIKLAQVKNLSWGVLPSQDGSPLGVPAFERKETPYEQEIWLSLGGLVRDVLGKGQTEEVLPKLRPHWQNLAVVDRKSTSIQIPSGELISRHIPPEQRMIAHSFRSAKLAYQLGVDAGLGEYKSKVIALGAFLHDIGKGAVTDRFVYQHILTSPSQLTAEEGKWMTAGHTRDGYGILQAIGMPEEIAEVARDHHSTQSEDPTSDNAQIVSIIDDSDVVTHARTYKEASPKVDLLSDRVIQKKLKRLRNPAFTRAYEQWAAEDIAA